MKGSPKPPAGEAQHVGQPGVDFRVDLPSEAAIVALAERQHGVVTLAQLMLFGLGKAAIANPAKDGRLYRVHRGVYAAGRPHLTEHGKWMAAALAYRPRAVISHRSAAGLLGIRRDNRAKADVTLPGRRGGAGLLRVVLADYEEPTITRRELEERFLALCRTASLPSPSVNTWITLIDGVAYQADFLWREHKLIVETDGRDVHTTRKAFEHDRERDQRLTLAGFTVVRFTWRQVTREPRRVAEALRGLLARLARP